VVGAGQTGATLVTGAISGTLNQGDIITVANVNAVNRVTKQSTAIARQFVVTAPVLSGATSIPIYPALIPGGNGYVPASGLNAQQYQTVDFSPANGSAISLFSNPGSVFRKNIAFAPQAVTMVTADLEKPPKVECARKEYDGISLRTLRAYVPGTDQTVTRCDCLFGYLYVRPEWGVIVADQV
jgi:hypothetical protein